MEKRRKGEEQKVNGEYEKGSSSKPATSRARLKLYVVRWFEFVVENTAETDPRYLPRAQSCSQSGHPTPLQEVYAGSSAPMQSNIFADSSSVSRYSWLSGRHAMARLAGHSRNRNTRSDQVASKIVFWYVRCPYFPTGEPFNFWAESLTSDIGEPPNTHVSSFDAAFPGTLPVNIHILACLQMEISHRQNRSSTRNA